MTKIHSYKGLLHGTLIRRYKRFLADVRLSGGGAVTAFCPNSGSMMGLNAPGAPVLLSHDPRPGRKTAYTLEMVRPGRAWVCVNTHLTNHLAAKLVGLGLLPELSGYSVIRPEVAYGSSRLDFLLADASGAHAYMEVKSVTLRAGGEARFPDAVTSRGLRHLAELSSIARSGGRAIMLYVIQRSDCGCFRPAADIDPSYAAAFDSAMRDCVRVVVSRIAFRPDGAYHLGQGSLCRDGLS